jgi:hypothetical protein
VSEIVPLEEVNTANRIDAWDESGLHYRLITQGVSSTDAARELERGASLASLSFWGEPLVWHDYIPTVVGANRLRDLSRWIDRQMNADMQLTTWLGEDRVSVLVIIAPTSC